MLRRVALSGLAGFVVLFAWTFVANVMFFFKSRVEMVRVQDEAKVHEFLKQSITTPGVYLVNPTVAQGVFPAGEPVYGITYSGVGHEGAGAGELRGMALGLVSALLVAWLLSLASPRVLAHYGTRVLFVAGLGLFLALEGALRRHGIGGYPLTSALLVAGNTLVSWTLAGAAIAAIIRPAPDATQA